MTSIEENIQIHRKFSDALPEIERDAETEEAVKTVLGGLTTKLPFAVNGLQVVARRYLQRTLDGKPVETPEQMFERVAWALAAADSEGYLEGKTVPERSEEDVEALAKQFFEIMAGFKFTPAGRTLANAGAMTRLVANCIVLHVEDSMDHIFQTLADAAMLQQSGSGLGFPLHLMRPAGAITKKSRGRASGPVSFLHIYNTAFGVIKQDNRNGANMAVMSVDHPDILEFIHCKDREGDLANFNVSVGLTDRFMKQVAENSPEPWTCLFDGKEFAPRIIRRDDKFNLVEIEETDLTARQIFMQIVDSAWRTGEPGCVFLDTVNHANPVPGLGRIEACNPCGEQFLHDGDVCNLGSLNLEKFVTADGQVDFEELRRVTRLAVQMLDNVIDISDFPVERVNTTARDNRRIGLGIMGFADMLYQIGVGYNTEEARGIARRVMEAIQNAAHERSVELAESKGVFPNWNHSVFAEAGVRRRNAALTNIAPTGTIAMMFNVSGGVEPYFALAYHYRGILGGDVQLQYFNKHLESALRRANCYSLEMIDRIERAGSLRDLSDIPESVRRVFVTSMDISARDHILMQAAMQEHCENAISKTINFPNSATRDDILEGYLTAWKNKCKGCTVYRDGSRVFQVLNLNDDGNAEEEANQETTEQQQAVEEEEAASASAASSTSSSPLASPAGEKTQRERKRKLVNAAVTALDAVVEGEDLDQAAKRQRRVYAFPQTTKRTQCPDCSDNLVWQEGCSTCHSCGYSACSRV